MGDRGFGRGQGRRRSYGQGGSGWGVGAGEGIAYRVLERGGDGGGGLTDKGLDRCLEAGKGLAIRISG